MNVSFDVFFSLSFIDLILLILIVMGAIIGYKKGLIVEAMSFFVLLIGFTASITIIQSLYDSLLKMSNIPDLFCMIILSILYIGVIYLALLVGRITEKYLKEKDLTTGLKIGGILVGALKYFAMASVYVLLIMNIEKHVHFLPDREKRGFLTITSLYTTTKTFRYLENMIPPPKPPLNRKKKRRRKQQIDYDEFSFIENNNSNIN